MIAPSADVSIIICAYTEARWNDLVAAVSSVRNQTISPREIVVVIDHNPALLARVQAEIPGVVVLSNRHPRGLSGARNSGIEVATGAILAFLDEDAIAERDWLAQLIQAYDSTDHEDTTILGVGGSIEPLWSDSRPEWFPEEFFWVVGCTYRGMPDATAPVRNLIGCNMSFRREVFEELGGFRNGIGRIGTRPVGCEETEFCIRLSQRMPEGRMLYEPRARVQHRVPVNRANWRYFFDRCYSEGLSKAKVASFVGAKDGLSSERGYALRTLPLGVLQGLFDAFLRFKPAGIARAGFIVAGLALDSSSIVYALNARYAVQWPILS